MVNEFMDLSPKKDDGEFNDGDATYRESCKRTESESSDEDTSSLLPLPDSLDEMRNELKSTINNLCVKTVEFEDSPKGKDLLLTGADSKFPTEGEVSLARKITSANLILDDLLHNVNEMPSIKERTPLVFAPGARPREKVLQSDSSVTGQSTETASSTSGDHCHSIAVTPFVLPAPYCDFTPLGQRCPCERANDDREKAVPANQGSKPAKKRFFLAEKMKAMRLKCRRRKRTKRSGLVDEGQQTNVGYVPMHTCSQGRQGIPQCPCRLDQPPAGVRQPETVPFVHSKDRGKCPCQGDACRGPEFVYALKNSRIPRPFETLEAPFMFRDIPEDKKESKGATEQDKLEPRNGEDTTPPPHIDRQDDKRRVEPTTKLPGKSSKRSLFPSGRIKTPGKLQERIDVYYFDHGNSAYYRTTDSHPAKYTEYLIERTDEYSTRFWAEIFGTVTIVISFIISFVLQLYRCIFTSIIRALTVGLIQIFSDYFFKPLLSIIFNGLIQPCLILCYNIATSMRDFCIPLCEICEFFAKDLAILFRSCRLVEINQKTCSSPSCPCRHNV